MGSILFFSLLVTGLICGAISASIATTKGREGGFLIGFLLGPIGVLIVAVMDKDNKNVEDQSVSAGTMKKCHFCAEAIRLEAIKCRFCGENLPVIELKKEINGRTLEEIKRSQKSNIIPKKNNFTIWQAVTLGDKNLVLAIIESGGNINMLDGAMNTAVDIAKNLGKVEIESLLRGYGGKSASELQ